MQAGTVDLTDKRTVQHNPKPKQLLLEIYEIPNEMQRAEKTNNETNDQSE